MESVASIYTHMHEIRAPMVYTMDQLLLPFLCFLTTIVITSLTAFTRRGHKPSSSTSGRLPSPSMLPIIGSIHHLIGPELPHRRLRDLARRHGPDLMLMRLGQVDYVVVSSHAAAEEVFKTHDLKFSSRPKLRALDIQTYGYTNILFSPYGGYWRQLRKICVMELLTVKRVKSFGALREEEISNLVEEISTTSGGAEPVNVSRMLMSLSNSIVFRAVLGKKCRHQDEFFVIMKEAIQLVTGTTLSDMFPSLKFLDAVTGTRSALERIHKSFDRILEEVVEEHESKKKKNEKEEDILDLLLRIKDSGELDIPLTRNNIKAVIADLFGAGTDTSSTTMEWAMAELMKNPEVMRKAQKEVRQAIVGRSKLEESDVAELKYLKLIIKETLRLHPPGPLLPRECTETCQVQGCTIPKGRRILVNVWALGTDPNFWEDADRFMPERFEGGSVDFKGTDYSFLPFGGGRRVCAGIAFGVATVEHALAHLLCYFDWKLPEGMEAEELDMSEHFSATVSRKSELYLVASRHESLPVDQYVHLPDPRLKLHNDIRE